MPAGMLSTAPDGPALLTRGESSHWASRRCRAGTTDSPAPLTQPKCTEYISTSASARRVVGLLL
jgi:hypothetical protein